MLVMYYSRILAATAALLSTCLSAEAFDVTSSHTVSFSGDISGHGPVHTGAAWVFPAFDPALGTLTGATVIAHVTGRATSVETNPFDPTFLPANQGYVNGLPVTPGVDLFYSWLVSPLPAGWSQSPLPESYSGTPVTILYRQSNIFTAAFDRIFQHTFSGADAATLAGSSLGIGAFGFNSFGSTSVSGSVVFSITYHFGALTVDEVLIKGWESARPKGSVDASAHIGTSALAAGDLISMRVDDVSLFSLRYSEFHPTDVPNVVRSDDAFAHVVIDWNSHTLTVQTASLDLDSLSPQNGVKVDLRIGAAFGIETVPVTEAPGGKLIYTRPQQ
jgi:hypothetical protein